MGFQAFCWVGLVALAVMQTTSGAEATNLDNIKAAVEIIGGMTTAGAIILGGFWAYFKFVKERTYRPRLEVTLGGQWCESDGRRLLHARIAVKNIGTSVVRLRQEGTGLRVQRLATIPEGPGAVMWEEVKVFALFREHEWIEPGETIFDDLLMNIPVASSEPVLFESRLVWTWRADEGNIVVFARQVITPDATLASPKT